MIISGNQVQNALRIYGKQVKSGNVQAANEVPPATRTDEVAISGASKIKQKAILAAKQAPDIREEKVNTLREAIASGTYAVSNEEVAEKMIFRSLVDKLV